MRESSPVLWMEIREQNEDKSEIYHFLSSLGYFPTDCGMSFLDIVFIKREPSSEETAELLCELITKARVSVVQTRQAYKNSYENSHSWKITAPLRAVRRLFGR